MSALLVHEQVLYISSLSAWPQYAAAECWVQSMQHGARCVSNSAPFPLQRDCTQARPSWVHSWTGSGYKSTLGHTGYSVVPLVFRITESKDKSNRKKAWLQFQDKALFPFSLHGTCRCLPPPLQAQCSMSGHMVFACPAHSQL